MTKTACNHIRHIGKLGDIYIPLFFNIAIIDHIHFLISRAVIVIIYNIYIVLSRGVVGFY